MQQGKNKYSMDLGPREAVKTSKNSISVSCKRRLDREGDTDQDAYCSASIP